MAAHLTTRVLPADDQGEMRAAPPPRWDGPMHHLTRTTLAGCAVILALGVAAGLPGLMAQRAAPPRAAPAAGPLPNHGGSGVDPGLTQRTGEWSVVCGRTGEPVIDFSPVDHGQGHHRMILTAHNCSEKPVTPGEPLVWFGGREGFTDYARLDPDRTDLTPRTLEPWASATAVLVWEPESGETGDVLSLHIPDLGEGELRDPTLGIGPTSRIWVSGWIG